MGFESVRDIVGKVWFYVVIALPWGLAFNGYVPEGLLASFMGKSAWWSVPVSVILGIPMYSNAAGIIPIVQACLKKALRWGTVLAFMMSVIALSLPEGDYPSQSTQTAIDCNLYRCVVGAGILTSDTFSTTLSDSLPTSASEQNANKGVLPWKSKYWDPVVPNVKKLKK